MANCPACKEDIRRTTKYVRCLGFCDDYYHQKCANVNDKVYNTMLEYPNSLGWRCENCRKKNTAEMFKMLQDLQQVTKSINEKVSQQQELLMNHDEILKEINEKIEERGTPNNDCVGKIVSYADKVKKNQILVIKPKNEKQNSYTTKEDLKDKIDPTQVEFSGLKNTSKGGIVIGCQTKEALEKLKEETIKKLGDKYNVNIPNSKKPKIKIVGLKEEHKEDNIIEYIKKQNHYIKDNSIIKVEHMYKVVKGRNSRFSVIVEVDGETYFNILKYKEIIIGWDVCMAYAHFGITQCFKCFGFYHKAEKCTKDQCCSKCGGDHKYTECLSDYEKCVNCEAANKKLNMKINSNHESLDHDCPVYKKILDNEMKKVDYSLDTSQ